MGASFRLVETPLDEILSVTTLNSIQRVQAALQALARGDHTRFLSALHPEVLWELVGPEAIPFAGLFRGREGVARHLDAREATVVSLEETVSELVGLGERVVSLGVWKARINGTDLVFSTPISQHWELKEGLVSRWRGFFDSAVVAAACRS